MRPLRVRPGPDRAGWFPAARANTLSATALKVWLEMARLGVVVTLKHFARRIRSFILRLTPPAGLNSTWNMPSYHIK